MALADVSIDKSYPVGKGDVFLSLAIGEGQFGTSDVLLGTKQLVRASGPIGKLLIGNGADIAGAKLTVRSVVNDVSTHTNRMSVSYKLTGGTANADFVANGQVAKEGDLLIFEATISF